MEKTLVIIKPDAMRRNLTGKIIALFEEHGLAVTAAKMKRLERADAEEFYAEHRGKPFFNPLIDCMTSDRVWIMVFQGENAVTHVRALLGATDPKDAAPGTIRKLFGINGRENSVHGSDSPASAGREIAFFFKQ